MKPIEWLRARASGIVRIGDATIQAADAKPAPVAVAQIDCELSGTAAGPTWLQAAPATRARHRDAPSCTCDLVVYSRCYPSSHGRHP